jgi:hypothetical protein
MSDHTTYSPERARAVIRLELALLVGQFASRSSGLALLVTLREALRRFR